VELSENAWRADLALLETEHRKLREALVEYIKRKTQRVPVNFLFGVAFHDVYHAGQIRLLCRLRESKTTGGAVEV
jgi:hypothetical protein